MPISAQDVESYNGKMDRDLDQFRRKVRRAQKSLDDGDLPSVKNALGEIDIFIDELRNAKENLYQKLSTGQK